jgi:hypothetical protein
MLYIISKIEGEKYRMLLDFLQKECDALSFQVADYWVESNLYNDYLNANVKDMNYEDGLKWFESQPKPKLTDDEILNRPDSAGYLTYKATIENTLKPFRKFVFKDYLGTEYMFYETGRKKEIIFAHFDESLLPELKKVKGLYDWQVPNLPEDLCFFKNGYCFLRSVAHEKLCFIYSNDKRVKNTLRGMGIYYHIDNGIDIDNIKFY